MSPDTEVKQIMTPRSSGVGARPRTALPQEANSPGERTRVVLRLVWPFDGI